jgi:hypothetical protein
MANDTVTIAARAAARAQIILHFLSEPMRQLPIALVEEACRSMRLEQFEQHGVVYAAGADAAAFYVVLAGARAPCCTGIV